ncbi:MAG: aldehyde dehydrogenase family protein, partial [Chthoniobacterales bacterium]
MKTLLNCINGKWVAAKSGASRDILNPATNEVIAKATDSGAADAEDAISAAREAFDHGPWGKSTGPERAEKLFNLANLIEEHADELAKIDTENNGKPLREANYDAADTAGCFRYYAGLASKPQGQTYSVSDPNMVCMTVREPIGVCAQIIPWNYPLLMAAWKLAPGLAAGNACILKPSEMTPVSAVKLFELIIDAGFPPGAANLVLGPGDPVGSTLAASDRVDKVAFTGGGVTGRKIMTAATGNLKKVTLELGGKSPN